MFNIIGSFWCDIIKFGVSPLKNQKRMIAKPLRHLVGISISKIPNFNLISWKIVGYLTLQQIYIFIMYFWNFIQFKYYSRPD